MIGIADAKPSPKPRPPNIIFIVTDDLDAEGFRYLGIIDSLLVKQGTVFLNHFVNISLCCPSRITTLRGQYAHNTGIYTNAKPSGGFDKINLDGLENSTVATWLQAAGYRTALFGKYLNGYPPQDNPAYIPPGWSYWLSPNGGDPYQEYNYSLNDNGTTVSYGNGAKHYLVDVLTQRSVGFIKHTVKNFPHQPFFIYLAPYVPHGPATPAPRYADAYPDAHLPRPKSFNENDVSDKPAWIAGLPKLTDEQIMKMDELYRKRLQSMGAVEDMVRELDRALQETKQSSNTYIFFTSDNGFHQGQHRLPSGKNTAFEEDIHVPLVVRGPGVPMGGVVKQFTANTDYAPTFAAIAKITLPDFVDGRSLLPSLNGQKPKRWRRAFLLEHKGPSLTLAPENGLREPQDLFDKQVLKTGEAPVFAGLRTSDSMTYVEYDTGERELYDLNSDPWQLTNIYAEAAPRLKNRLSRWLAVLRQASGKTLRKAEVAPPP